MGQKPIGCKLYFGFSLFFFAMGGNRHDLKRKTRVFCEKTRVFESENARCLYPTLK
jgi:hypothetical protein